MPFYRETLLSAWPPSISDVGAPPVRFDAKYLDSLQKWDIGSYGRNNRGIRRNQVEDTRASDKSSNMLQVPKFLSEKSRESANSGPAPSIRDEEAHHLLAATELESLKADAPSMYRAVEIKFSRFGVDDFDFGLVNMTIHLLANSHRTDSITSLDMPA